MPCQKPIPFTPDFPLELFMRTCELPRLSGAEMETLSGLWAHWAGELEIRQISSERTGYVAIWLKERVEQDIDKAWTASPGDGYLRHALARTLCLCAVQEFVPEVEDMGCAPLPRPAADLAAALAAGGLACKHGETLIPERRYAVVTARPFRGGCETCSLRKNCPRSGSGPRTLILPGYVA